MRFAIAFCFALLGSNGAAAQAPVKPVSETRQIGVPGGRFVFGSPVEYLGVYMLDTQTGQLWKLTKYCDDVQKKETCSNEMVLAPVFYESRDGAKIVAPVPVQGQTSTAKPAK